MISWASRRIPRFAVMNTITLFHAATAFLSFRKHWNQFWLACLGETRLIQSGWPQGVRHVQSLHHNDSSGNGRCYLWHKPFSVPCHASCKELTIRCFGFKPLFRLRPLSCTIAQSLQKLLKSFSLFSMRRWLSIRSGWSIHVLHCKYSA